MNIKILIAMTEAHWLPDESMYVPLQIGKRDKEILIVEKGDGSNRFIPQDVSGINIADKYEHYGVLTALYYGWKNIECDAFGLLEQGRYFSSRSRTFLRRHKDMQKEFIIKSNQLEEIFQDVDVVVPIARWFPFKRLFKVLHRTGSEDLNLAKQVVEDVAPEYLPYVNLVYRKRRAYMDGLFVMKKRYFDSYCEFLFKVIGEMEYRISKDLKDYNMDVLSHVLFNVWLAAVQEKGAKVMEIHCMNMDNARK